MAVKILDAFALLAFFRDEPGAQLVEDFIFEAQEGNIELSICVINLGEILYSISRSDSPEKAASFIEQIQSLPIEIVNVDWELTRQAAFYKTKGGVSYADCFAAALAKLRHGELVTGDREFKSLANDVKIAWLK